VCMCVYMYVCAGGGWCIAGGVWGHGSEPRTAPSGEICAALLRY